MTDMQVMLERLTGLDGVRAAVIVSRDGFVIDSRSTNGLDPEVVGAVVSAGITSSQTMGNDLAFGDLAQSLLEYRNGFLLINLLGAEALLAVVADPKANLGHVRYQVKKQSRELANLL